MVNVGKVIMAERGVARADAPQKAVALKNAYPWAEMALHDSFPMEEGQTRSYNLVSQANSVLYPKRFSLGKDARGLPRVWRVA